MKRGRVIPLDLNESYWLADERTLALARDVTAAAFATYPDYAPLQKELAEYLGVEEGSLCLAPGSDEAIRTAIRFCAGKKYRALIVLPTFSGYERVLTETPLDLSVELYGEREGKFEFPFELVMGYLRSNKIDVLFLCEPNNPLASTIGEQYGQLLDAARDAGVLVISDEAYIEFAGQSAVGRVESQSLIIFRTLSKGFGVPGIRVGCAVASKAIADELRTIQFGTLPWPIAGPSVHAARVCLSRAAVLAERRAEFIQQTARFSRELAAFPDMLVYPSATNFILTRHPRATDIVEDAAGLNVRIALAEAKTADPRAKQLLRSTMRFAIPSPEDMPFVLQAISATLDNTATSVL